MTRQLVNQLILVAVLIACHIGTDEAQAARFRQRTHSSGIQQQQWCGPRHCFTRARNPATGGVRRRWR